MEVEGKKKPKWIEVLTQAVYQKSKLNLRDNAWYKRRSLIYASSCNEAGDPQRRVPTVTSESMFSNCEKSVDGKSTNGTEKVFPGLPVE